ncbi:Ankyrin repeat and SOCS box protein 2 [Asimina triloba]
MAASLRHASVRPPSDSLSTRPPPAASAPCRLPGFATPEGIRKRAASAALVAGAGGINNFNISAGDGKKKENPIIVIDNYDSFTYNLCQYIGELGTNFEVYRNDELTIEEMKRKNPRGVLISPGPGTPQDSGISLQTVLELGPTVPLFGVCMGLQCIGEAFGEIAISLSAPPLEIHHPFRGIYAIESVIVFKVSIRNKAPYGSAGRIVRSPTGVMHGKSSQVFYDEKGEDGLLAGLSNANTIVLGHGLVAYFVDDPFFHGVAALLQPEDITVL